MSTSIEHPDEQLSNEQRRDADQYEPLTLRTFTPTKAVLMRSAGIFHWTPENRRLYDFTSGVLVANLGHHPISWTKRFFDYMDWPTEDHSPPTPPFPTPEGFYCAVPLTAYNALTLLDIEASERLIKLMRSRSGGARMEQVLWAASGSEAVQKALWASLARDRTRPMILATRRGFHGKKGLAGATTGTEADPERDPRVRFIDFPMAECVDVDRRERAFDPTPYREELDALWTQFGRKIGTLITEPYLGGGGSYHPHPAYLQMLQDFCREQDVVLILDEVQSNFGRTGSTFAYQTYGLEPDIVVLGKGLGNGIPVSAAVGRADLFAALDYGEGSDTWSASPLSCAAVLATLDEFAARDILTPMHKVSAIIEEGLIRLKELPFVRHVRGERGGMVWGVEMGDYGSRSASEWANEVVLVSYRGEPNGDGIHLLGPLAKKVLRVAPPLVITEQEAREALELWWRILEPLARG